MRLKLSDSEWYVDMLNVETCYTHIIDLLTYLTKPTITNPGYSFDRALTKSSILLCFTPHQISNFLKVTCIVKECILNTFPVLFFHNFLSK